MITVVKSGTDRQEFMSLPDALYEKDPNWVKPLLGSDLREFSRNSNPALRFHDMVLFLCRDNSKVVGRAAAFIDRQFNHIHEEKTAFFGFFECAPAAWAAEKLLMAAADFARTKGMKKLIGPVDISTNYQAGFLIDNFIRPSVMTPYNKPYYPELVEKAGFHKLMDFYSYDLDLTRPLPERFEQFVGLIKKRRPEISVKPLNQLTGINRVSLLEHLYNKAFCQNWGYVPMTRTEFAHLLKNLEKLSHTGLNYVAFFEGVPVGLLLTVPDLYSPRTEPNKYDKLRVTVLGVIPGYRRRGIEAVMGNTMAEAARRQGYKTAEFSVILETNSDMNNFVHRQFSLPVSKTYRVYEKQL